MKAFLFFYLFWIPFSHSLISILSKKDRYLPAPIQNPTSPKSKIQNSPIRQLLESNQQINRLLSLRLSKPHILDLTESFDFPTGTILKGKLLNSIVSTNLASPLMAEITNGPLAGAKIHCIGVTSGGRIQTDCPILVFEDREYPVSVTLLNPDGTAGLLGQVYEGKEQAIASKGAQHFIQGLSQLGQKALGSPIRTKLLETGTATLTTASGDIKSETGENSSVVLVKTGKPVLAFFNREFKP
jgi:hypothetical protein